MGLATDTGVGMVDEGSVDTASTMAVSRVGGETIELTGQASTGTASCTPTAVAT